MTILFSIFFIITIVVSTVAFVIFLITLHKPVSFVKTLSKFKRAAADSGISVVKNERIGNRIIGVDTAKGQLLFFSGVGIRPEAYYVDICDIKSVDVNKEFGLTFNKYSRRKPAKADITRIALYLTYKNGRKRMELPFYDKLHDSPSDIEKRSYQAKKWRELISFLLDEKQQEIGFKMRILSQKETSKQKQDEFAREN